MEEGEGVVPPGCHQYMIFRGHRPVAASSPIAGSAGWAYRSFHKIRYA